MSKDKNPNGRQVYNGSLIFFVLVTIVSINEAYLRWQIYREKKTQSKSKSKIQSAENASTDIETRNID